MQRVAFDWPWQFGFREESPKRGKERGRTLKWIEMAYTYAYLCVSMPIYAYLGLKVQLVTSGLMD